MLGTETAGPVSGRTCVSGEAIRTRSLRADASSSASDEYEPWDVRKVADLLREGAVVEAKVPVYEAHVP